MPHSKHIERIIEQTADGSHTLFVPSLNEHYHSVNGAIQEAEHVFINEGLKHSELTELSVFEVGFGTGLNAFLTAKYAMKYNRTINYVSIEAYPLPDKLTDKLNYGDANLLALYKKLHQAEWESKQKIDNRFFLTKIEDDFTNFDFTPLTNQFDVIYFDAFAPDVQEQMWTQELFGSMFQICKPKACLVTYCAKGEVRRRMQRAGFYVERLAGPPGKREMLRASKL